MAAVSRRAACRMAVAKVHMWAGFHSRSRAAAFLKSGRTIFQAFYIAAVPAASSRNISCSKMCIAARVAR